MKFGFSFLKNLNYISEFPRLLQAYRETISEAKKGVKKFVFPKKISLFCFNAVTMVATIQMISIEAILFIVIMTSRSGINELLSFSLLR